FARNSTPNTTAKMCKSGVLNSSMRSIIVSASLVAVGPPRADGAARSRRTADGQPAKFGLTPKPVGRYRRGKRIAEFGQSVYELFIGYPLLGQVVTEKSLRGGGSARPAVFF